MLFGAAAHFAHRHGRQRSSRRWQLATYPLAGLAIAAIAPGSLGGLAFLGSIGLVFALVYREDPDQWWAVIPAGALFSLAAAFAFGDGASRSRGAGGSVFLLGLGATFFVLTRLPRHARSWAVFPAAILAVLAVLGPLTSGISAVPVLLIAIGAWLLLRPDRARSEGSYRHRCHDAEHRRRRTRPGGGAGSGRADRRYGGFRSPLGRGAAAPA